jgi:hypothetical protein
MSCQWSILYPIQQENKQTIHLSLQLRLFCDVSLTHWAQHRRPALQHVGDLYMEAFCNRCQGKTCWDAMFDMNVMLVKFDLNQ